MANQFSSVLHLSLVSPVASTSVTNSLYTSVLGQEEVTEYISNYVQYINQMPLSLQKLKPCLQIVNDRNVLFSCL